MDARITKSRLANLFSYDWLKIIAAILAVVFLLIVFFTTIKTRARSEQEFIVYAYSTTKSVSGGDADMTLLSGEDTSTFADDLLGSSALSYDVLSVEFENFGSDQYSETLFSSRRMAGLGTVMLVSDYISPDKDPEETELVSTLDLLFSSMTDNFAYDTVEFLADCEEYLVRFFGEDWKTGALNEEEAEACFLARNEEDNRYHLASQKKQGIEDEKARLEKLREDYIFVTETCFGSGVFEHTEVTLLDDEGEETSGTYAVNIGALPSLHKLVYHNETRTDSEGNEQYVRSGEDICLIIFKNPDRLESDLRFETISFLRYLYEEYGA